MSKWNEIIFVDMQTGKQMGYGRLIARKHVGKYPATLSHDRSRKLWWIIVRKSDDATSGRFEEGYHEDKDGERRARENFETLSERFIAEKFNEAIAN